MLILILFIPLELTKIKIIEIFFGVLSSEVLSYIVKIFVFRFGC